MSPITDQENALLNLAPGSPVTHAAPPGLGRGKGGSGHSSCFGSPMSLGSLAVGSSLAINVHTCPGTPLTFSRREELPRGAVEEEEEEMDTAENDDADQAKDWTQCDVHPAIALCLARHRVEPDSRPNERTRTAIWRKDTLLKQPAHLVWHAAQPNCLFYSRTRNTWPAHLGGAPPCLKLIFLSHSVV